MRTKPREQKTMQARWMISFADFLSVVLAFMVLIYSSGQNLHDTNKFSKKEKSYFSVKTSDDESTISLDTQDATLTTEYLENVFSRKFQRDNFLRNIPVHAETDRLVMNFTENFFNSAEGTRSLVDALAGIKNGIRIYARDLDVAYRVTQKLQAAGVSENISFFESSTASENNPNGIDIAIYP